MADCQLMVISRNMAPIGLQFDGSSAREAGSPARVGTADIEWAITMDDLAGRGPSTGKAGGTNPGDRNREAIEAITTRVEKTRSTFLARDQKAARYWVTEPSGRLGVKVRTEILVQCLQRAKPGTAKRTLAGWLQKRMAARPPKRGATGPGGNEQEDLDGRKPWSEDTFYSWLLHRE